MRVSSFVAFSLAIAGCYSKPTFQGDGDGGDDGGGSGTLAGVSVVGNGLSDPITVRGPEFELGFPDTSLVHLPDRLMVGDVNVLGRIADCPNEDAVGFAVYPALSVSANEGPMGITSTPTVLAMGPAFGQVRVSFAASFVCSGPQTITGSATFTAFPDGRIVRSDRITPSTSTLSAGACGCGSATTGGDFFVTSFLTLQDQFFTQVTYDDGAVHQLAMPLPPNDWIDTPNLTWACASGPDSRSGQRRVGVAWPGTSSTTMDNGTRIKPNPPSTTFLYDWLYGAVTVPSTEREMQTAWFVGTGMDAVCDATAMEPMATGFVRPRALDVLVDGTTPMTATLERRSGIYVVTPGAPASRYEISVVSGLEGVPAGFAISVVLATAARPKAVLGSVALVEGRDFLWQQAANPTGGVAHTVWLATALDQGTRLTITAP